MSRPINWLPAELWQAFRVCRTRARWRGGDTVGVGVKALSLTVTDGFSPLFTLTVSPWRLGHISSVIINRVLCLYEMIEGGRKQREDTSNRTADICLCPPSLCKNLMLPQPSSSFSWSAGKADSCQSGVQKLFLMKK